MEGITFNTVVKLFFQYGPFAILPFIAVFALPKLYKQLKAANKDLKIVLKRSIWIYQVVFVLLLIFCVGFWTFSAVETTQYYSGEIVDLNAAEYYVKSRNIYLKDYFIDKEYVVSWLWKKEKEEDRASVKLIGKDPATGMDIIKEYELSAKKLKKGVPCTLKYNAEDGALVYAADKKPLELASIPAVSPHKEPQTSSFLLYACPPGKESLDIANTINLLQAIDPDLRKQAVDYSIRIGVEDKLIIKDLLSQGLKMIAVENTGNLPRKDFQPRLYNRSYLLAGLLGIINGLAEKWKWNYTEWKNFLGEKTIDVMVEELSSTDPTIKALSFRFLSRFDDATNELAEKSSSNSYRNNRKFINGTLSFLSKLPQNENREKRLNDLKAIHGKLAEITPNNAPALKSINPGLFDGKKKEVIELALELKNKRIPFKWGGKTIEQGMDSSGFIAYILSKTGLLKNPGEWWSGRLREEMGVNRPEKKPTEPGDLVFFMGGHVMLYLGDNIIIGMTANGVIEMDYTTFPSVILRVNRIDYEKGAASNK